MKRIAILGSTGSIGTQTLQIVRDNNDLEVVALAALKNVKLMEQQVREFHPKIVCMCDENAGRILKTMIADTTTKVVVGMEGLIEIASFPDVGNSNM